MPRFDGTGPFGYGPLTGRGIGSCGRGYGCWYGGFAGFRRNRLTKAEEVEELKGVAGNMRAELESIEREIKEIESAG